MNLIITLTSLLSIFILPAQRVDAQNLDFIVSWDKNCSQQEIQGQELAEGITSVSISEVADVLVNPCSNIVERDRIVRSVTFNDSRFQDQWSLRNTGQTILGSAGRSGRDIGFTEGYDKIKNTPNGNTTVAVIDTGVSQISELTGKLLPGRNTIQDNSSTADDNGHGTFITSLMASISNNNQGISGVNDRLRILPVKVLDNQGEGFLSDLIKGIQYAIDNNVDLINLSLVSQYTDSLNEIIKRAYDRDIIVIAATGNEGKNLTTSKVSPVNNDGDSDWVIGVGSHDNRGNRTDFSNFGQGLDVLAPGDNIIGIEPNNSFTYRSGTSAAAAIATGVIASWRDFYGDLSPDEAHNLIDTYSTSGRISMNKAMVTKLYPDGLLIKSPTSGVYLLEGGKKLPITSPQIFLAHNFKWENIVNIPQNSFDRIPNGKPLKFRDGTLIADSKGVFVIENQQKRPIPSPQSFLQMGYQWSNIWSVDQGVLNLHPTGSIINPENRIPNGTVVSAPGTGLFLIEGQKKRPIPDPYTYLSHFNWERVVRVTSSRLNTYSQGSQLLPRSGTILANSSTVFFVEENTRRPFVSPNAFLGLGLEWSRVDSPGNAIVNRLKLGSPIQ